MEEYTVNWAVEGWQHHLERPAAWLRSGRLVAFPTETVYGLGGNAFDAAAVERIFAAKGRPSDNPLIVHVSSLEMLEQVVQREALTAEVREAMTQFWPGPLTLLLPPSARVAVNVYQRQPLVGVRMPNHPVALELIRQAGVPVAAPSANLSGRPSPTHAADVALDLAPALDALVDGGACAVGIESTVLRLDASGATIYRPGAISVAALERTLGLDIRVDPLLSTGPTPGDARDVSAPLAPGMKYRHYAPDAPVFVWSGPAAKMVQAMAATMQSVHHHRVALIGPRALVLRAESTIAPVWTNALAGDDWETYAPALAQALYASLREADRHRVDAIYVVGVPAGQEWSLALTNRLMKASEGRIFDIPER